MKKILSVVIVIIGLNAVAQPVAKVDTIYLAAAPAFVTDTINFNLIANDSGTGLKVLSYNINCRRYAAGATWRDISNFGKIRIYANGSGTFITKKPTTLNPTTSFKYSIDDGKCGTAMGLCYIRDSIYYWTSDTSRAYATHFKWGVGYYIEIEDKYYVQLMKYPYRYEVTREEYEYAIQNRK